MNIQHPGELSLPNFTDATTFGSHWFGGGATPRSATIVITRDDGGRIGT